MAAGQKFFLTEREVGAGTDPDTGAPVLILEHLSALGLDIPDQRHLMLHDVAVKLGSVLLAAGNHETMARLLTVFGSTDRGVAACDFGAGRATTREALEDILRTADDRMLTSSERVARMRTLAEAALKEGR